jgi:hypothetical protein
MEIKGTGNSLLVNFCISTPPLKHSTPFSSHHLLLPLFEVSLYLTPPISFSLGWY